MCERQKCEINIQFPRKKELKAKRQAKTLSQQIARFFLCMQKKRDRHLQRGEKYFPELDKEKKILISNQLKLEGDETRNTSRE